MALRVTQGLMYSSFVGNMNRNLSALMESNIQSSSQKKVNRPSDDPIATGRILSARTSLNKISIYDENVKEAMGWLSLSSSVLAGGDGSVQNILTRIKVLAEQGSQETYTAEQRYEISLELREHFKQLITVANQDFAGSQIFAGHKTDQSAYVEGLAVSTVDGGGTIGEASFNVVGSLDRTMIIQATDASGNGGVTTSAGSATYRYSMDGGKTWTEGVTPQADPGAGQCTIIAGGVEVRIDDASKTVVSVDTNREIPQDGDNGTWLYVRPTAVYQGDDHDTQVVNAYKPMGSTITANGAEGSFPRDVAVKLDKIENGNIYYSYSLDDGNNWTQVLAPDTVSTLPVPGGYLELSGPAAAGDMGAQFIIHPHRADIKLQIGDNDSIAVNLVGKDIFGGLYNSPKDTAHDYPVQVGDQDYNLFEVIGNLVAAAECNDPDAMGAALPLLDNVMNVVLTKVAEVGGRQNRLVSSQGALMMHQFAEEDNLSAHEDVDVTELMTRLAQQQIAYNSVLKSSSMIMQMSLVNFL